MDAVLKVKIDASANASPQPQESGVPPRSHVAYAVGENVEARYRETSTTWKKARIVWTTKHGRLGETVGVVFRGYHDTVPLPITRVRRVPKPGETRPPEQSIEPSPRGAASSMASPALYACSSINSATSNGVASAVGGSVAPVGAATGGLRLSTGAAVDSEPSTMSRPQRAAGSEPSTVTAPLTEALSAHVGKSHEAEAEWEARVVAALHAASPQPINLSKLGQLCPLPLAVGRKLKAAVHRSMLFFVDAQEDVRLKVKGEKCGSIRREYASIGRGSCPLPHLSRPKYVCYVCNGRFEKWSPCLLHVQTEHPTVAALGKRGALQERCSAAAAALLQGLQHGDSTTTAGVAHSQSGSSAVVADSNSSAAELGNTASQISEASAIERKRKVPTAGDVEVNELELF